MYTVGTHVIFTMKRCNCAGGGVTEMEGQIIGVAPAGNIIWYQVSTSVGVFYAKDGDIISSTSA